MTLLEFRYGLEHILFPKYFFEDPLALMASLFGKEDNEELKFLRLFEPLQLLRKGFIP